MTDELEVLRERLRALESENAALHAHGGMLFNEMLDGFALHEIICDAQGRANNYRFLDVNPAFEKLTGLTRAQVLGKTVLEVLPQTEAAWIETFGQVALTGVQRQFERYARELDRTYRVMAFSPQRGRFAVIFEDISARKQAENALRESEEKFRAVLEQFSDGFALVDEQGQIEEWNPAMQKLTGLPRENVLGKPAWQVQWGLTSPGLRARRSMEDIEVLMRGMLSGARMSVANSAMDITFEIQDGQTRVARQSLSVVRTMRGVKLGILLHDITSQKMVEAALQESEERYRQLVELSPSAVFVESQNRIVFANPACVRLFGAQNAGQILEMSNIDFVHPDYRAMVLERIRQVEQGQDNPPLEEKFIRLDGSAFDVEVSSAGLSYQGRPARQIIVHDISGRKQAEATLKHAHADLQAHVEKIEILQEQLREQATHDYLTGLFNRRYLQSTLDRELAHAVRERQPVALLMMDMDHFKRINDTHGHRAGDLLLEAWGEVLKKHIRRQDIACRYGGEEFVIVMPGAGLEVARQRAEWLCKHCAELRVSYEGHELQMTISMGVAVYPQHAHDEEELLICADRALYFSKRDGRNRVSVYQE